MTFSFSLRVPPTSFETFHTDHVFLFVDGAILTWSRNGRLISTDLTKRIKDDRISITKSREKTKSKTLGGFRLSIKDLKRSDGGDYSCELHQKNNVQRIVHHLTIIGNLCCIKFLLPCISIISLISLI